LNVFFALSFEAPLSFVRTHVDELLCSCLVAGHARDRVAFMANCSIESA
jgi:hypothetical protein